MNLVQGAMLYCFFFLLLKKPFFFFKRKKQLLNIANYVPAAVYFRDNLNDWLNQLRDIPIRSIIIVNLLNFHLFCFSIRDVSILIIYE